MPDWCPNCSAMLPEGTKECPRCGALIESRDEQEFSREDLVWYSGFTIGIVLIPLLIVVLIGVICVLIFVLT